MLVLTDGGPSTAAIATQLDREGVPYTAVSLADATRPAIDPAYLENVVTGEGRFQAVVLPNQAGTATHGLTPTELTALTNYELAYGVRQVDAYVYPGTTVGLSTPAYSGSLDGSTATVTAQGLAGPFPYLKGSLPIDDVDPATTEIYGYLAAPAPALPAGETFTPLLNASVGTSTGSVVGVYSHAFREELVITAAFNSNHRVFNEIGHGIVTWMTRGLHLGYHRNYFAVHIDDIFLADSRWSAAGHCTPGDGCVDPTVTTTDIRMTPADVSRLLTWQSANGHTVDLVFNASGSDLAATQNGGTDPLTAALTAAGTEDQFTWVNHTYTHTYLGCIQIAPTAVGQTWRCANAADTGPYIEPELVPGSQTLVNGTQWLSQAKLTSEIQQNLGWVATHPLTHFDPAALVTGEHSGLLSLPQQTIDNPFLAPALAATGIKYTASDASRESLSRAVGAAVTVPRHPMNIFYNVGTYGDEVSEYNWIYTSAANGGSGLCTANPTTSTCITPLEAATAAQAKASFDSYITPLEVRNAYNLVVTGDPRPFYAHQSNLAEDGVLYPVMQGVLDQYKAAIDTTKSPIVHADMKAQAQALSRMTSWGGAQSGVTAYVDSAGVHVSGPAGTEVPLTVPAGTTVNGSTLGAYDGELSGWLSASATDTVVAVPAIAMGGYVGVAVPPAPVASAIPANASAVVSWSMPGDGGTPVTGYVVTVYSGTGTTVLQSLNVAAPATTVTVTGLTNGTAYSFDVAAVNGLGTGPASARTAAVTPSALPGAPVIGVPTRGNASAVARWTAPPNGGSAITGYRVRVYTGTGTTVLRTVTAAATATSLTVTGLTNGTAYTFDVAASNVVGTGPASARSAAVTPATVPGAPVIGVAVAGVAGGSITATSKWTPPASTGGSAITGYRVTALRLTVAGQLLGTTVSGVVSASTRSLAMTLPVAGSYRFKVQAINAVGSGAQSPLSNMVTAR
ncbi:MAG: fibronectin type III domain-containing protein [Kineosporiaceae bacterium]